MRYRRALKRVLAPALLAGAVASAAGQSSSLYLPQEQPTRPQAVNDSPLSPAIAANSFIAVRIPEPRQFVKNDLVTVIIRESFKTDLKASLETEKKLKLDAEVSDFIDLDKLLELVVRPDPFNEGNPNVGVNIRNKWDGEGDYSRSESMTGRITARVADVKPNGTLVLEVRQTIITDKEELAIVLTGTCRADDITIDNTVLSTEMYDLHLDKQHKGELKKSTKKGFLTNFFDALFGF